MPAVRPARDFDVGLAGVIRDTVGRDEQLDVQQILDDFPAKVHIDAGQNSVGRHSVAAGGHRHLGDHRNLRQVLVLFGQGELDAEIEVLCSIVAFPRSGLGALSVEEALTDAELEPVDEHADAPQKVTEVHTSH